MPEPTWQYYRRGVIANITEEEARHAFDGWQYRSDERGMALFLIEQMWREIDRLRAENATLRDHAARLLPDPERENP